MQGWKRARTGLLIYGAALLLQMVLAVAMVGLPMLDVPMLAVIELTTLASVVLVFTGVVGIVLFAGIPDESGAKTPAIVAAVAAVLQLLMTAGSFGGMPVGMAAIAGLAQPVLSLVALFAMLRALMKLGLALRADSVYERASALSTGTALLLVVGLGSTCLAFVAPELALLVPMALLMFALILAIAYALLVLKAAKAIRDATGA